VKFGGFQGGVDGHIIIFSLEAWFSCDEQNDCRVGLFFSLGCIRLDAKRCKERLSTGQRKGITPGRHMNKGQVG